MGGERWIPVGATDGGEKVEAWKLKKTTQVGHLYSDFWLWASGNWQAVVA
jgi:hypothetical protein